jgi:hypothetical protein
VANVGNQFCREKMKFPRGNNSFEKETDNKNKKETRKQKFINKHTKQQTSNQIILASYQPA